MRCRYPAACFERKTAVPRLLRRSSRCLPLERCRSSSRGRLFLFYLSLYPQRQHAANVRRVHLAALAIRSLHEQRPVEGFRRTHTNPPPLDQRITRTAFPRFESYRRINLTSSLKERALARVSKDGHKRDRASGHPLRDGAPQVGCSRLAQLMCRSRVNPRSVRLLRMRSVGLSSIRPIRLVSWNRSTRSAAGGPILCAVGRRRVPSPSTRLPASP